MYIFIKKNILGLSMLVFLSLLKSLIFEEERL